MKYSRDRLSALRDEWNDPYFDIEKVLARFRGRPWAFGLQAMRELCEEVALLLVDERPTDAGPARFRGSAWLTPICAPMWQAGAARRDWKEVYGPLCEFLFDVGFLGCAQHARRGGSSPRIPMLPSRTSCPSSGVTPSLWYTLLSDQRLEWSRRVVRPLITTSPLC